MERNRKVIETESTDISQVPIPMCEGSIYPSWASINLQFLFSLLIFADYSIQSDNG